MQTTRYPLWKSVLWVIGILAYGLGATVLSALAPLVLLRLLSYLFQMSPSLGPALNSLPPATCNGLWLGLLVGLWVGLPAVAIWQVTVRGNKTARLALAVMAAFVVVLCVFLGSGGFTGKWWLGWIGVPDPYAISYTCDGPISGPGRDSCAHDSATMTAVAPHPPDWLPWGPSSTPTNDEYWPESSIVFAGLPMEVTLHDLAVHPERYEGRHVRIYNAWVLHVYAPTEFTIGTPSDSVYVVTPPLPYILYKGDNIAEMLGSVGGPCRGHYPAKVLLCALIYAEPEILLRATATPTRTPPPWWKFWVHTETPVPTGTLPP